MSPASERGYTEGTTTGTKAGSMQPAAVPGRKSGSDVAEFWPNARKKLGGAYSPRRSRASIATQLSVLTLGAPPQCQDP